MATTKTYTLNTYSNAWANSGTSVYTTDSFRIDQSRSTRPLRWSDIYPHMTSGLLIDVPDGCYVNVRLAVHGQIGNDTHEQIYTFTGTTQGNGTGHDVVANNFTLIQTDSTTNTVDYINSHPTLQFNTYNYMVYTFYFYNNDGTNFIVNTTSNLNYYSVNTNSDIQSNLSWSDCSEMIGTTQIYYTIYNLTKLQHTGLVQNVYDTMTIEVKSATKSITVNPLQLSSPSSYIPSTKITLVPTKYNGQDLPEEVASDVVDDFQVSITTTTSSAVFTGTTLGLGLTYKILPTKNGYQFYGSTARGALPTVIASDSFANLSKVYGETSTGKTHVYHIYLVEDEESAYPVTNKPAISTFMSYLSATTGSYPVQMSIYADSTQLYNGYSINTSSATTVNGITYTASTLTAHTFTGEIARVTVPKQSRTEPLPVYVGIDAGSSVISGPLKIHTPQFSWSTNFQISPGVNASFGESFTANGFTRVFLETSSSTVNEYAVCIGVSKTGKWINKMASEDDLSRRIACITSRTLCSESDDGDSCESMFVTYGIIKNEIPKIAKKEIFDKNSSPYITTSGNCINRIITKNEKLSTGQYASSNKFIKDFDGYSTVGFFGDWARWSQNTWPDVCPESLGETQACKVTDLLKIGNGQEGGVPVVVTYLTGTGIYNGGTYVSQDYQMTSSGRTIVETGIAYSDNGSDICSGGNYRTSLYGGYGTKTGSAVSLNRVTGRIPVIWTGYYYYAGYAKDSNGNMFFGETYKYYVNDAVETIPPSVSLTNFQFDSNDFNVATISGTISTAGSRGSTGATITASTLQFSLSPTFDTIEFTTTARTTVGTFSYTLDEFYNFQSPYYTRLIVDTNIAGSTTSNVLAAWSEVSLQSVSDSDTKTFDAAVEKGTLAKGGALFISHFTDTSIINRMVSSQDMEVAISLNDCTIDSYNARFAGQMYSSVEQGQYEGNLSNISGNTTCNIHQFYDNNNYQALRLRSDLPISDIMEMLTYYLVDDIGYLTLNSLSFKNLDNLFNDSTYVQSNPNIKIYVSIKMLVTTKAGDNRWVVLLPKDAPTTYSVSLGSFVDLYNTNGTSYATAYLTNTNYDSSSYKIENIALMPYHYVSSPGGGMSLNGVADNIKSVNYLKIEWLMKHW